MPLYAYDDKRIKLNNEITEQDFELGPNPELFEWFQSNFSSAMYANDVRFGNLCETVAGFMNEKARGPYFLLPSYINNRDVLEVILFDPRDRAEFAQFFTEEFTPQSARAANENATMIVSVMRKGGYFENSSMQDLLEVVTAQMLNGGQSRPSDIEALMTKVWEEPVEPQLKAKAVAAGLQL